MPSMDDLDQEFKMKNDLPTRKPVKKDIPDGKKRTYQFECPNCGTKSQDRFLAYHNEKREPILECTKCKSRFSSRVFERLYYMGRQQGQTLAAGESDDE